MMARAVRPLGRFSLLVSAYGATGLSFVQGLLTAIILTRHLSVEEFGVWSQFRAVANLATTVLSLNLGHGYLRFAPAAPPHVRSQLLLLTLAVQAFLGILGLVVTLPWLEQASQWLFDQSTSWLLVMACPAAILALWQSQMSNALIAVQRPRAAYLLLAASRVAVIAAVALAALVVPTVAGVVAAMVAAALASVFVGWWMVRAELTLPRRLDASLILELLRFCLPLFPTQMALWVCASSDRLFLKHFLDLSAVAHYSLVYSFAGVVHVLYAAVAGVFLASLSRFFDRGDREGVEASFSAAFRLYWVAGSAMVVVLTLTSLPLTRLIATSAYAIPEVVRIALWISVSSFVFGCYQIFSRLFDLERRSKSIGAVWTAAMLLNLLLNYVLIPIFGISGAAMATALSYGATFGLALLLRPRAIRVRPRVGRLCAHAITTGAVCYASLVLSDHIGGLLVGVSAGVLVLTMGVLLRVVDLEDLLVQGRS